MNFVYVEASIHPCLSNKRQGRVHKNYRWRIYVLQKKREMAPPSNEEELILIGIFYSPELNFR